MSTLPLSTADDAELEALFAQLGQPTYRAQQLRRATWQPYLRSFDELRQFSQPLRAALSDVVAFSTLTPRLEVETDSGLTVKLLASLQDGASVESVAMETPPRGRSARRCTVCVSTQVGCAVGCPFCATGRLGLTRNCTAAEIVDQVRLAGAAMHARGLGPVTHVVYMGMGEPLANYDATVRSLHVLTTDAGLSARRITVSTSGIATAMERFANDAPAVTLAVSLHAATDELRDRLVPLNRTYPLARLTAAATRYAERTGRRVTYEWCLIGGVNDSREQADALCALARSTRAHVNLIPMNHIAGSPWGPPTPAGAQQFLARLRDIRFTVRDTRGSDIDAACGQLRASMEARRSLRDDGTLAAPRRLVSA